jgi:hypothetical protein
MAALGHLADMPSRTLRSMLNFELRYDLSAVELKKNEANYLPHVAPSVMLFELAGSRAPKLGLAAGGLLPQ